MNSPKSGPPINVVMATHERPEMFRVAVTSALEQIPNISTFVVIQQSDYDPKFLASIKRRGVTLIRCPPDRNAGIARQRGFTYLWEHSEVDTTFLMDDDMTIMPGFADGLPLVLELLGRPATGFVQCSMLHIRVGRTQEVILANIGGGVFCRSSMVREIGGLGDDILDDIHSNLKARMAGFRNYITGQIRNDHKTGSKGGLQASSGSKNRTEKRHTTRAASRLNELYPGLFRKWDPVHRVFNIDKSKLPPLRA